MWELMILNLILKEKNWLEIDDKYFLLMNKEYNFIKGHYLAYGQVCDESTMLLNFEDFDLVDISENQDYIIYKIKEAFTFSKVAPLLESKVEDIKVNSIEASKEIISELNKLVDEVERGKNRNLDIISTSKERYELYKKRREEGGTRGISTGIDELDKILYGWMSEDLITIFARTNEGKSMVALYFASVAWKLGKKVLFYSGEMSREVVGYRLDTFLEHYSNTSLMRGLDNLDEEKYKNYIDRISDLDGFYVVTPRDLGGKAKVTDIAKLEKELDVDLIIVDQLTLMDDVRKGENKRIRYNNIAEDLFGLSEMVQKPIIAVTQARRDNNKKKEEKDNPPELDEIYESDGIAQSSTRVISMKCVGRVLKLAVKKNRYGEKDKEILLIWDKDEGYITSMLNTNDEAGENSDLDDYGF